MLEAGDLILWINLGYTPGKTDACTKVITKMIKSMALEFTLGQTRSNIKVGGTMASSMVSVCSPPRREKRDSASGKMERSLGGLVKMK